MSEKVIPFAPSLSVVRTLLTGECSRRRFGKDLARTLIAGERMLSVPVEGGSARLKRTGIDPRDVQISDHGVWRREHLGAWNAVYGKTPFFAHLYPLIEEAYNAHSRGSLAEFNGALWNVVADFLGLDSALESLDKMKMANAQRFFEIREEFATKVNLNYSIFDALFRLGKNVLFLL